MKHDNTSQTIAESIVFIIGIFLLSMIVAFTNMQNNACTDEQKNRHDYVCKEINIYA